MTFDAYLQKVASNIQRARKNAGFTQEKMQDFGFNYRYYQKIEGGQVNLTLKTLWSIAKALKSSITNLTRI